MQKLSYGDYPRIEKPRTVNFCPYCRAVVAAVVTLLFVWLWRRFPHKEKKQRSRAEITRDMERRSLIIRSLAGGINIALGIKNIVFDDGLGGVIGGLFQIIIGVVLITAHLWGANLVRWIIKHSPRFKWKRKHKPKKIKEPKKPSEFLKKVHEKHELICPPIFFVDIKNPDSLR